MSAAFIHIGTTSLGLGVVTRHFLSVSDMDLYLCDHDLWITEKFKIANKKLKDDKFYFIRNTNTNRDELVEIKEFIYVKEVQRLKDLFASSGFLYISFDIGKEEMHFYNIIFELILLRSISGNPTFIISCIDDLSSGLFPIKNLITSYLMPKVHQYPNIHFLQSIFNFFTNSIRITKGNVTVFAECDFGNWTIKESSLTLIENELQKKEALNAFGKVKLKNDVEFDLSIFSNLLVEITIQILAFFSQYNDDNFIHKHLQKHIGQRNYRRIVTAIIAIYNITDYRIISEFKRLNERLLNSTVDCVKILPWLIEGRPDRLVIEDFKKKLKFENFKNVDFREIEILCIFFKKIGVRLEL